MSVQLKGCVATAAAISPGIPATFLSNYQAAMAFLDGLETYCASRAALTALRRSPFYASFLRRWKLSIYFSTRFQVGPRPRRRVVKSQHQELPLAAGFLGVQAMLVYFRVCYLDPPLSLGDGLA